MPCETLARGELSLPEDTSRYVVKVHRLAAGDEISLFDPMQALEAEARVVSARLPSVVVLVEDEPRRAETFNLPVHLLQAVGKGDKPEQAVRDAVTFGATRVSFVHTERGVAKSSSDHKQERLLRVAAQVARQCGRADLPRLDAPRPLSDVLSELPEEGLRLVCAWADDAVPLLRVATPELIRTGVTVLIGPEGGLDEDELRQARSAGFSVIDLGPYVLRTEVACSMVLGCLRAGALL